MMKDSQIYLFLIVFGLNHYQCDCQSSVCDGKLIAGPENAVDFNEDFDQDQGFGYVVYKEPYIVQCCGTIRNWEFSIGDNGDIELQVWRHAGDAGELFELVGFNTFEVHRRDRRTGYISYDVEPEDMISVRPGDVIGWYAPGDSLVDYNSGTAYDGIWKLQHDDSVKIGDVVDFSGGIKQEDRTYGIQAKILPNSPPKFVGLQAASVAMDAALGTPVRVIEVSDDDLADIKFLKVEQTSDSEFFDFDPATNILSVGEAMSVPEGGQTFQIEFKVTDPCGDVDVGTLEVTVDYVEIKITTTPEKKDTESTTATSTIDFTFTEEDPSTRAPTVSPDDKTGVPQAKTSGDRGGGWLIGGVVAAVLIIVIVIIIVISIVLYKKNKNKAAPKTIDEEKPDQEKSDFNKPELAKTEESEIERKISDGNKGDMNRESESLKVVD